VSRVTWHRHLPRHGLTLRTGRPACDGPL